MAFRFFFVLGAAICINFLHAAWTANEAEISLLSGKAPSWDFTNLWMGARLAISGQIAILLDVEAYRAAIDREVVKFVFNSDWSYPPPMLLVGAPFAFLSLNAAYILWTVTTLALFTGMLRIAGASSALCALMVFSPAAMMNIVFGQNGAPTAALLIGGLAASDRCADWVVDHQAPCSGACACVLSGGAYGWPCYNCKHHSFRARRLDRLLPDHCAVDGFIS